MQNIKIFITDIDGVWTDGTMFYTKEGEFGKTFHTYDSAGILFLKMLDIPTAIVTGENSPAVEKRAEKLQIPFCFTDVKNKVEIIENLLNRLNLTWNEVAYIGDDINDLKVFKRAALTACPAQAPDYIKKEADWILEKRGGEGAFREFVEKFLREKGLLEEVLFKISHE